FSRKGTALFGHLTPRSGEHSRLNGCPVSLDHYTQGAKRWVLDTKWKRLDSTSGSKNYGLSQSDFYQLFAYGQKYLGGEGDLVLIYPRRASFQEALPGFEFSAGLRLWVVPFDLLVGQMHGLEIKKTAPRL
ncbi:hypothetical protein KDX38_28945, partial [Pseudomonas sp. CDFA 602]|uniref:McrC family protein n=1 Tax=Pseudomonas californiensis TaxID=2829823 RepID=UPI001E52718D|nr:hypothetical protein [Pseudomonas californiensis]MCD6003166.1 hypothetical protein [Pseudomonas californiensis]